MREDLKRTLDLSCPSCSGVHFEIRVMSDDELASARCVHCDRTFLVLDSEEHWLDAIQTNAPRVRRCSCKSASFSLKLDYLFRDDGDVKKVSLWSRCSACDKTKRQMSIGIDYSDTADLVTMPLRHCENPNLRYDLKNISLYLEKQDMAAIIAYLGIEHGGIFACSLWGNDVRVTQILDVHEVQELVLADRYLHIHVSFSPLTPTQLGNATAREEQAFWKRHAVVSINSPLPIGMDSGLGLLYFIEYANEFIENGAVALKAVDFRATTAALLDWLNANFVNWRGKLCFDNPTEHRRLFKDQFSK